MLPEGKSAMNTSCVVRQRINARRNEEMIPLKVNDPFLRDTEKPKTRVCDRRRGHLHRLNSAPLLHSAELPPIANSCNPATAEKRSRPLTPLIKSSGRNSSASSRSLPKNYRINLDLTPLVEVGTWNVRSFERMRQTSVGSDLEMSSDSLVSNNSPKFRSLSSSPKALACLGNEVSSRSTDSTESLEEAEDDSPQVDEDGKDKMILRWLQSIETKNNYDGACSGELLPSIKEGRQT